MYRIPHLDLPAMESASGSVRLPGSKSISNRVLLLAALCEGSTTLHDVLDSDDTQVMLAALTQLGCTVERLEGQTVRITGLGDRAPHSPSDLFMGNAGTAMRPLTAALSLLGGAFHLHGVARMHERPIGDLVDALRQLGCQIHYLGQEGYPPLQIQHADGPPALQISGPIQVRGDVSSQFLTALLLALPLASRRLQQAITLEVVGTLISKPYIAITLALLRRFGVDVQHDAQWQHFTIPANSRYQSPGELHVEADASSASYFIALGALAADPEQQQCVRILGVGSDSIQGDIRFVEAATAMGAQVRSGPSWIEVQRGQWPLQAIDLDCNHIPDAAMTLAVMALYANGTTTLRNIASWRVKETDRIAAMAQELRKLGAAVEEGTDFLRITPPQSVDNWHAASIHTYDDHRMAMCFSLAAFNPAALPVRMEDPRCVGKTFPDYFEHFWAVTQPRPAAVPVICIDGPTASGKGTIAAAVAERLGFALLDSGALYRIAGLLTSRAGLEPGATNEPAIAALARHMPVRFDAHGVWLEGENISDAIRTEAAGIMASRVSALPLLREALLDRQHAFCTAPGLVADGRDMGTVVFPTAPLKVFMTASAATRAQRRYNQLKSKGISAKLDDLLADLEARDARDRERAAAPLKPAEDALLLDNSALSIEETVAQVLAWWEMRRPFASAAAV